jgi:hypothetical protein
MKVWSWYGAGEGYTVLLPVRDEDIFTDVFVADGQPKTWTTRPQVKPGIERVKKKQKPLGDMSPLAGASIILNEKAHVALEAFLAPFGQFLELDLVDETGFAGGDQPLFFYNVTNLISCIDAEKSQKDDIGIVVPVFFKASVPKDAQVFKDPLMSQSNIFLNDAAYAELERLIGEAGLRGSSFRVTG